MRKYIAICSTAAAVAALALTPATASARVADGLPDSWEAAHHLSLNVNQANLDQDRDGLKNAAEFRVHTNPRSADTDHDGVNDANEDADNDGLTNLREDQKGSDPEDSDSDNDGVDDGDDNDQVTTTTTRATTTTTTRATTTATETTTTTEPRSDSRIR